MGGIQITVKTIRSLARGLQILEAIAAHQPVGLTALCVATGEDKSALQRILATLHSSGWIQPASASSPQWELAAKPIVVSGRARQSSSLQGRARRFLGPLRDRTNETVHLALLDNSTLVVADVAEGTHVVRTALPIGQVHPFETSSAGRAIFAHLSPAQRADRADSPEKLLTPDEYEAIRQRGWASSAGAVLEGSNSIGAAILDSTGAPVGALVISGPANRLTPERCAELGAALVETVSQLSHHH
ncbi:IclR family transcriptional regulator [Rhodococcus qingshengii]|uniref:IclR family transcriptional regulator n=1 Tax=Rhodococcus qingshengii TaxID=334542 RepID=UPI0030CFDC16